MRKSGLPEWHSHCHSTLVVTQELPHVRHYLSFVTFSSKDTLGYLFLGKYYLCQPDGSLPEGRHDVFFVVTAAPPPHHIYNNLSVLLINKESIMRLGEHDGFKSFHEDMESVIRSLSIGGRSDLLLKNRMQKKRYFVLSEVRRKRGYTF